MPDPFGQHAFVHLSSRYGQHRVDRIVDGCTEEITISLAKLSKGHPGRPLVPVREGMVPGEVPAQHSSFHWEAGVELHATEACLGCIQRGVGEVHACSFREYVGAHAGHCLRDDQVIGEVEVLVFGQAKRSRISRSSSMI